jgi:hypothetical protein
MKKSYEKSKEKTYEGLMIKSYEKDYESLMKMSYEKSYENAYEKVL